MYGLRRLRIAALFLIVLVAFSSTGLAQQPIQIVVNGQVLDSQIAFRIADGTLMGPIEGIANALGAEFRFDEANQRVILNSAAARAVSGEPVQIQITIPAHMVTDVLSIDLRFDGSPAPVTVRPAAAGPAPAAQPGAEEPSAEPAPVADDLPESVRRVPNEYGEEFLVADDELFIFVANYRPFEVPGFLEKFIGEPLRKAFPDVKFKLAVWDYPVRYDDLQAAGVIPDIVIDSTRLNIDRDLESRGWAYDMTELIKKSGLDLSKLNPAAVELVRSRSDGGMYGVPFIIDEFVLLYNKTLFDRFGVPYPRAGMTYDEAYELAKQMTRQVGPVSYKGYMQHADHYLWYNQLGLQPFSMEEPDTVEITTDEWVYLVDNIRRFPSIQGNVFTTTDEFPQGRLGMAVDNLYKVMRYANVPDYIDPEDQEYFTELTKDLVFDIVPVPVLPEAPNTIYQPNLLSAHITKQSNKKELAMEVIKFLVSEEMQLELAKNGMKGVLETPEIVEAFGSNFPQLANINTEAVYWGENAVPKYNPDVFEFWNIPLWLVFRQYIYLEDKASDVALQLAEEEGNKYIQQRKAAQQDW